MHRSLLASLVLLCATTPVAAAGKVWIVDDDHTPGANFQSLGHALLVAGNGDVILLRDGVYSSFPEPFWIVPSKSLTLAAEPGHTPVLVDGLRTNLLGGQELVLRGLRIAPEVLGGVPALTAIAGTIGGKSRAVLLEDCAIGSIDLRTLSVSGASFAAIDCTIGAFALVPGLGHPGMSIEGNWSTALYRTTVTGHAGENAAALGGLSGGPGGNGVELRAGASLFAMSCVITGANGGAGATDVSGCGDGGAGGDAIRLFAEGSRVESQSTVLVPGAGGSGAPGCSDGMPGLVITDPAALVIAVNSPHLLTGGAVATEGQSVSITLEAQPFETVFLYSGIDLLSQTVLALGPYWLAGPVKAVGHSTVPISGQLVYSFQVPELGVGNLGAQFYMQAFCYDALSNRFAMTSPTVIIGLDPSVPSFP